MLILPAKVLYFPQLWPYDMVFITHHYIHAFPHHYAEKEKSSYDLS